MSGKSDDKPEEVSKDETQSETNETLTRKRSFTDAEEATTATVEPMPKKVKPEEKKKEQAFLKETTENLKDSNKIKDFKEANESKDFIEANKIKDCKKIDENKNCKENIEKKNDKESGESGEIKESKNDNETKNNKESKESKDDNEIKNKKESLDTKQPFVFGQNTKFGSTAFSGLSGRKNVFGSSSSVFSPKPSESKSVDLVLSSSKEPESGTPSKSNLPFVFGAGSKFSNAFKAAGNKKSIFETFDASRTENKPPLPEVATKEDKDGKAGSGNLYQAVKLEKKEVKSGEEEEISVFQCKAKLYMLRLDNLSSGWKERGVGMLHINKYPEQDSSRAKARIVMRTIGILKVVLNAAIGSGFEVFKGMESSLHSEKFVRFNSIEMEDSEEKKDSKNPRLVQYAIRVGSSDTATELYDRIREFIPSNDKN